jgi:mannose-6-phosphate isomerase-like protein (cupin superfamily)
MLTPCDEMPSTGVSENDRRLQSSIAIPRRGLSGRLTSGRSQGSYFMTDSIGEAIVLRPGDGRTIDLGNFKMSVKAEAPDTGGLFSLLEAAEPAGFGPPLHIHHDAAESFYVLEGEYIIFLEDQEMACPAGSFIFIPAGMKHGFRVGDVASRKLNLYAPAAMVGYFDELSGAIKAERVDDEALAAIALKYSMEVLGPVPEGYA